MKKLPDIRDVYKSIRKPVPPPTKAEQDRREKLKRKDARREMEENKGKHGKERTGPDDT